MAVWAWILIALAIVAVVCSVVAMAMRRRRTATLRRRFGPEYYRTMREREDKGAAEADLLERQQQRDHLNIKPLPEATRAHFAAEWRELQERFVDQPPGTVVAADDLVRRVMASRGYPVDDFEAQARLVSVDHPAVVDNYRIAHSVCERATAQRANTEELRAALLHYRRLLAELLVAEQVDDRDRDLTVSDEPAAEHANTPQSAPGGAR